MALIGYARVSTELQDAAAQRRALKAAGCVENHEEFASGAARTRPMLGKLIARLGRSDVLVVVPINRLARSLSHLLNVSVHRRHRRTGRFWCWYLLRSTPNRIWRSSCPNCRRWRPIAGNGPNCPRRSCCG